MTRRAACSLRSQFVIVIMDGGKKLLGIFVIIQNNIVDERRDYKIFTLIFVSFKSVLQKEITRFFISSAAFLAAFIFSIS